MTADRAGALSAPLLDELERGGGWMYPWRFAPGVDAPPLGDNLPDHHRNRESLIGPVAAAALAEAGPAATGIDLACNEGWFAHRLLDWGADRVVGIDIRADVIRRAALVRDHFRIPAERLRLECADAAALRPGDLEPADVVLLLGVLYHVEEPVRLLRRARELTRGICLIETQLAREPGPVHFAWGTNSPPPAPVMETPALLGAFFEGDQGDNPLASHGGVLSFVPNESALFLMVHAAGFPEAEIVPAGAQHSYEYRARDRVVMVARP